MRLRNTKGDMRSRLEGVQEKLAKYDDVQPAVKRPKLTAGHASGVSIQSPDGSVQVPSKA
jgi:hypothetical protein